MTNPWLPLDRLADRFAANLAALSTRYPDLAATLRGRPNAPYSLRSDGTQLTLGRGVGDSVQPLPASVSPKGAFDIRHKLCPTGNVDCSILIAGEDLGWLWDAVYRTPVSYPGVPGFRPPLFLLHNDLDRLAVILHVQDWADLLADGRVRLFAGLDAIEQMGEAMYADVTIVPPRLAVTLDKGIWPKGVTLESLTARAQDRQSADLAAVTAADPPRPIDLMGKIRVLGVTSRYTSFLQYSMRDWLSAFDRLGHETRLVIEPSDFESTNTLTLRTACAEFKPDLVVIIDHSRATTTGLPPHVPVVMWSQDRLPQIYNPAVGAAQGPLDFVIGYGRHELTRNFNYPPDRFMPAMLGVNDERFTADPLPASVLDPLRCDVSFVSHASTPADVLVKREMDRVTDPGGKAMIADVYDRLVAIYQAGGSISSGDQLRRIITDTLTRRRMATDVDQLQDVFASRINNALFRHQAIEWVAELGVDLRLYGNGWEKHPTLSKFARGPADNTRQLHTIYQASAINLQVTPFGAVHQRLLDGLAAGGFFLLRPVTADRLELLRRRAWDWCAARGIDSGGGMLASMDDELRSIFTAVVDLGTPDPADDPDSFFAALQECAMTGFSRTPETLFDDSHHVSFDTRDRLHGLVRHYLASPDERRRVVSSMRPKVLAAHTYLSTTDRLIRFVSDRMPCALPTKKQFSPTGVAA